MAAVLELIKYVLSFEKPIATVVGVILIVFLLSRKFVTSEYVTAGKQGYEELERRYKILSDAYEELERQKTEIERRYQEFIEADELKK